MEGNFATRFVARGGLWVLAQVVLLVIAYLVPEHYGRALPLEQSDVVGGAGFVLLLAGILQFAVGAIALGPALTPFPQPRENAALRTTGIYSLVRHPIYSGIIIAAIGWSLYLHSWEGLAADAVLFLFFDRKATREEKWLLQRFPAYSGYRQKVRKLIPWLY